MQKHIATTGLSINRKKLFGVGLFAIAALGLLTFGISNGVLNTNPAYAAGSSTDFVTTWKTDNEGQSNDSSVTIPISGVGANYEVDWNNDGEFDETGLTDYVTHDFGAPGEYTVRVRGVMPQIMFSQDGDALKIISVDQWGDNTWKTMVNAFQSTKNLSLNATDAPDLSQVKNMNRMFAGSGIGDNSLSNWQVGAVTDMSFMFAQATSFNGSLANWNVGNVTNMAYMFSGTESFNQDLSSWDVSNVRDMMSMFQVAKSFDGSLANWNVGNVTNMRRMFSGTESFNQDLSSWTMSNIQDLSFMFFNTKRFNGDVSDWNVSGAQFMNHMFYEAESFNQDLSTWEVGNTVNMAYMFSGADRFSQDISTWDVSNVTDMSSMFYNSADFSNSLASWNVTNVTNMTQMFNQSGLTTDDYDATLVGWSKLDLKRDVSLGASGVSYCNSAVERQYIIESFNWTIAGDRNCSDDPRVNSVDFVEDNGKKSMVVNGEHLIGVVDPLEYYEGLNRSFVRLDGVYLPFCSEGFYTGFTAAEIVSNFGVPEALVSDNSPCYYFLDDELNPLIDESHAIILLPGDFADDVRHTVSVNGSNTYVINANSDGNGNVIPTLNVNGNKPITKTPTIPSRPTFSGVATPGAKVVVTVRSDPISCSATADASGNWSCTLPRSLAAGRHSVTVIVTNPDGSVEKLGPYAVVVAAGSEGATITSNTPLAPNTGLLRALQEEQSKKHFSTAYLAAFTGFIVVVIASGVYLIKKRRQSVRFTR